VNGNEILLEETIAYSLLVDKKVIKHLLWYSIMNSKMENNLIYLLCQTDTVFPKVIKLLWSLTGRVDTDLMRLHFAAELILENCYAKISLTKKLVLIAESKPA